MFRGCQVFVKIWIESFALRTHWFRTWHSFSGSNFLRVGKLVVLVLEMSDGAVLVVVWEVVRVPREPDSDIPVGCVNGMLERGVCVWVCC